MNSTWRALANPERRRLIELLRDGPRTTGDLCAAFQTSRFAVMKHLRVLERGGLVTVQRDGRKRWNHLNLDRLQALDGHFSPPPGVPQAPSNDAPPPSDETQRRLQVFIDAVPWRVFDGLTQGVAAWWGAPHLRWPGATNLILEPQPGGRFCEEWGHRQGALRGTVTAIRQNEWLELTGPIFGPHVHGCLSFSLQPHEGGTLLTVAWDEAPADAVEDLVRTRLKRFVEQGARSGVAG